jgi:hypothetical protein
MAYLTAKKALRARAAVALDGCNYNIAGETCQSYPIASSCNLQP